MLAEDLEALYPLLDEPSVAARTADTPTTPLDAALLARAEGCLLGQLAGDSLGSLVEFQSADVIRRLYPEDVRELADGGSFNTLAGQPTDDSEMALMLARSIVRAGRYDAGEAAVAYSLWFDSPPFDNGQTTAKALRPAVAALTSGDDALKVAEAARWASDRDSQANGALMRVSPLGIFAHALPAAAAAALARDDAALTHPHPVCQNANAAFVGAIAHAVATGSDPEATYTFTMEWVAGSYTDAGRAPVDATVREYLKAAKTGPPKEYLRQQGWVLIALQNAFWQLLHASSLEAGVTDTVMRGGDTDTNAAIAGALLGAVHGAAAIPAQWSAAVLSCRPELGRPGVHKPRAKPFWPLDALTLARRLVELGGAATAEERQS